LADYQLTEVSLDQANWTRKARCYCRALPRRIRLLKLSNYQLPTTFEVLVEHSVGCVCVCVS